MFWKQRLFKKFLGFIVGQLFVFTMIFSGGLGWSSKTADLSLIKPCHKDHLIQLVAENFIQQPAVLTGPLLFGFCEPKRFLKETEPEIQSYLFEGAERDVEIKQPPYLVTIFKTRFDSQQKVKSIFLLVGAFLL